MSRLCQSSFSKLLMEWYLLDWVVLEQSGTWRQHGTHKRYAIRKSGGITAFLYGLVRGWPTSQRATFLTALLQTATSHILAHVNITPSFPHSHTYLCSARFIVNTTHQHNDIHQHKFTSHILLCTSLSGTSVMTSVGIVPHCLAYAILAFAFF